ncbi:hypothetical protein CSB37_02490 [bacterium DOLZORAL124_38_8]|nr:MAG: hypothetical protein CSB37_02490 [bacterium DOLZORAL124_38_8]
MATQKKILGNAFAQIIGKFLTILASLVVVKLLTGFGKSFYGNYLTSYEFLAFFGILADAGLFAIAVREISKSKSQLETQKIFGNIFSIRLLFVVVVMLLAVIGVRFVPNYPAVVKNGVLITAVSMGLTILCGTLSSVLQARMKIHWFSLGLVLSKVILALGIWALFQNGYATSETDFYSYLGVGVLANFVFLCIVWWFVRQEVKIRLQFDFSYWKKLLTESLPFGLALILQTLYLRLDILLISFLLGSSAVGMYGVSTRVLEALFALSVFFGHAVLPKISAEETDVQAANKTLSWAITVLLAVVLPIIMGLKKFSNELVVILSNKEFLSVSGVTGANTVLSVLAITVFFAFFNQLFTFSLVAKKRQNYMLKVNALALLLNGVLNVLFLPQYGIIAAAYSTIVSAAFVFLCLQYEVRKQFTVFLTFDLLWPVLLANGGLLVWLFFTPIGDSLPVSFVVGGLWYGAVFAYYRKRYL